MNCVILQAVTARLGLLVVAGVALLAACAGAATTAAGASPARAPVQLQVPKPNAGAPFDHPETLTVPAGWHAEVWARVPGARYALWTPSKTLLVSATTGSLVELIPGHDPASPPAQRVLAANLSEPQGLAFDTFGGHTVLYVAESNQVDRYVWNKNGSLGSRTVVIAGLPDADSKGDDVHRLKGIAIGAGHRLYVTVGSSSNANGDDTTSNPPRGAVYSFNDDGSNGRIYGTGVRNGEGLAFDPDGVLWTAVNERDNLEYPFHQTYGGFADAYGRVIQSYVNENPPDEVAKLTPGRNLGWPFCNPSVDIQPGNPAKGENFQRPRFNRDVETNPTGAALNCSKLKPIERPIPAHSAPLSLTFLENSTLPAHWRGGALVTVHGSWDRLPPRAPAVLWLPWDKASRTLEPATTLIAGFQTADGNRWGRPVDAVAAPGGVLYVTDDTAGAVYRFTTG
jgi:glucose/arabinose dehydrogenase